MAVLKFSARVEVIWADLVADGAAAHLLEQLNLALDLLEEDPGDPRVRRRRFTDPPVWCFIVRHGAEDWAVLWEADAEGDPVVVHIGPVPF